MVLKEKELNPKLKMFKHKDVVIEIKGDFSLRFNMRNINIYFDEKFGLIYVIDYTTKNIMRINITTVYSMELEHNKLKIQLENTIITLTIKCRRRISCE